MSEPESDMPTREEDESVVAGLLADADRNVRKFLADFDARKKQTGMEKRRRVRELLRMEPES